MSIGELISKLREIEKQDEFCHIVSVLTVNEDDTIYIGDFEVDGVEWNKNTHSVELRCRGKRTNFLRASCDRKYEAVGHRGKKNDRR